MEQQIEFYTPVEEVQPQQLPTELVAVAVNSGLDKAEQHAATFAPFMIAVKDFSNKAQGLNKEQPSTLDAQIARQIRLAMVKNRTAADQAKDAGKAGLLAESNLIQSLFNVVVSTSKMVEADLAAIEKFAELKEQARQSILKMERASQLEPYLPDPNIYPLGTMSEEAFQTLLTGSRLALEQKQLAEQQAEAERLRAEAERLAEQERIREENERLRQEVEEKQKLQSVRLAQLKPVLLPDDQTDLSMLWQMSQADFDSMIEIATLAKDEREAAAEQARQETERIQAEKDAQAEQDRLAKEAKLAEIEESNRLAREKAQKLLAEKEEADRLEQERVFAIEQRYDDRAVTLSEIGLNYNPDTRSFFNMHLSVAGSLVKDIDDATFETQLAGWKHHIQVAEETARLEEAKRLAEIEAAKAPERDRLKAWVDTILIRPLPAENLSPEAVNIANEVYSKLNAFKTWALQQIEAL